MCIKVNLVSAFDKNGGAAKAAYRIHRALLKSGALSSMYVNFKETNDDTVVEIRKSLVDRLLTKTSQILLKCQKNKNPILHSLNIFGSRLFNRINQEKSDIVNIHWINHETISIKQISKIKSPVVFTLHDMWAFSGSEHYVIDNDNSRFRLGYEKEIKNEAEKVSGFDFNRYIWMLKKKFWKNNITIVTGSSWLSKIAKDSVLFSNFNIVTIPNAIDTDVFAPSDKFKAKEIFSLKNDQIVIGFAAVDVNDKRKGFDLFIESLKLISNEIKVNYVVAVIGNVSSNYKDSYINGVKVLYFGNIDSEADLSVFYNSLDLMVVPSRQDHMPQTGTEAHACGVPVVAFNTSGMPDIITHKKTGYLAQPYDPADLAFGIQWCITNNIDLSLSKNARKKAEQLWSFPVVGDAYVALFNSVISK